jgi:hypothetical protein
MGFTRLKLVVGVFVTVAIMGFGASQLIPAAAPTSTAAKRVARPALRAEKPPAPGGSGTEVLAELMRQWEKDARDRIKKDAKLKALAMKHHLVVLHSRHLYMARDYKQSAYSFIHETSDVAKHGNDVQLLFHNGGSAKTFCFNMIGGQENLIVDLGTADFAKDPDPAKISIDHKGVFTSCPVLAVEGKVYLERVRDTEGNNFYVLFQVIAVDKDSRYMAFLWRKLPGGKVVKR